VQAKRGPEFYMQQQRVERQGIGYLGISMLFQEAFIDSDAKRITLMDRAHFSTHNGSAKSSISNSLHAEISFQKLIDRAHFSTHNGSAKSRDRAHFSTHNGSAKDRAHFSTHNGSAKSSISNSLHAEISFQKLMRR